MAEITWSAAAILEEAGVARVLGEVDCPAKAAHPENTGWVVREYCTQIALFGGTV